MSNKDKNPIFSVGKETANAATGFGPYLEVNTAVRPNYEFCSETCGFERLRDEHFKTSGPAMDEAVLRGPHIIQHWKTFPVFLEKTTGKDPGFVFHEKLYNSSELLITGVVVGSDAYTSMQKDEIRFLDVIEKLNDQPLSSFPRSFAEAVQELPSVKMLIKRPLSLPPTSKLISEIKRFNLSPSPTHILVLKHDKEFGLSCDSRLRFEGLSVTGSSKDTPARQCGLEYGDIIQMFATATPKKMGDPQRCFGTISDQDQFERALSEAATNGQSLILVISRPLPETPQSSHPIDVAMGYQLSSTSDKTSGPAVDEAVLCGPHIIQHWKTFPVFLEKTTGKDPGFVFHEKLYNSSELLITGVVVGSDAYTSMQKDEIRFLDVIEKLNDQPLSSFPRSFAEAVQELPSVKMLIKRPLSLPPTSKLISEIKRFNLSPSPTHILVLKHDKEFGLSCDSRLRFEGLSVTGSSKDTPARQCGLEYGDIIQMFATATPKKMGDPQRCFGTISNQDKFERALSEAATNGQSLILVISRPLPETPQSSNPIE